jgi:hypothetical protein
MIPSAVTGPVSSDVLLNLNVAFEIEGRWAADPSPTITFNNIVVPYVANFSNYVVTISAADINVALGSQAINTVLVTVTTSLPNVSPPTATLPFTVTTSANVDSAVAPPGYSANVSVSSGSDSVNALLITAPSDPGGGVTVVLYGTTSPVALTPFKIGGTYFDVVANGATCLDTLTVNFQVDPGVPGMSQDLFYSPDGGKTWNHVTDDSGVSQSTDTTGLCGVVFDCGSSPPIDQLTGTIFFVGSMPEDPALMDLLNELITLQGTVTVKETAKDLGEPIKDLRQAARAVLWTDPSHPVVKTGSQVFEGEEDAVQDLVHLIAEKHSGLGPDDVAALLAGIDSLVSADQAIAQTALDEATAAGLEPQKIREANKELAKGDAAAAAGKPDQAIQHYMQAWSKALDK